MLDVADSANSNNFVLSKSFTSCSLGKWPISESKLLNGTKTSSRHALISNNCHLYCGWGQKHIRGRGAQLWLYSTSTSTQIPNQKTSRKNDISRKQHSKQANITQGKCWKVTQKIKVCWPGFHNFRYTVTPISWILGFPNLLIFRTKPCFPWICFTQAL